MTRGPWATGLAGTGTAWDRLRGHSLGGDPDERLVAFVWSRVGKDLDVDVLLTEPQLFQRQANRLFHRVGLDFDAGHSPLIHRYPRMVSGRRDGRSPTRVGHSNRRLTRPITPLVSPVK